MTYPTTLDDDSTLLIAVNNCSALLAVAYTAGGTSLDLDSAGLFPSTGGVIYVGNERTTYTGKTSNTLTGVSPLSNNYAIGAVVNSPVDASHHNLLKDAVVALETKVGVTGSSVAGTVMKRLSDIEGGATAKTTPVDADTTNISDSAASGATKTLSWANIKAALKTYFDSLYVALTGDQSIAGIKTFSDTTDATSSSAAGAVFSGGVAIAKKIVVGTLLDLSTSTAGHIKFPSAQNVSADANTLDDYEEGVWTPTVSSTTGSITSYTSSGTYTKIGRTLFLTFTIGITNAGTAGGVMIISGLPFNNPGSNTCGGYMSENQTVGIGGSVVSTGTTTFYAKKYDGGNPVVTNYTWAGALHYYI